MKKKITIDQLKPGMYVVSTNRSWLQLPFFRKKISSQEIVSKLKSYNVTNLVIDTSKGIDLNVSSDYQEVNAFENLTVLKDNISKSSSVHQEMMTETSSMMEAVRDGKGFDEQKADRQVNVMLDQILEDPQSMLCVSALKNSDEYTFSHCVNLSILSLFLGNSLGMKRDELFVLGKGALLHDIGKCMIPNEILSKPGKLSSEEVTIIKTHVDRGVNYLKKMSNASRDVLDMVAHHHERLNGSGYPAQLVGDQISWFGKLIALMDVYDAVTHENYYKDPEDPKTVMDFLSQDAGKLFDEKAFKALSKCLGEYPPGTLLMLDSGEICIVYEPNYRMPEHPRVLLMTRPDGTFRETPEPCDLSHQDEETGQPQRNVVTSMTQTDVNFNPFKILEKFSSQSE